MLRRAALLWCLAAAVAVCAHEDRSGNAQLRGTRVEQMPLIFVPGSVQGDARVLFTARASGAHFLFRQDDAALVFQSAARPREGWALVLTFPGASGKARIEGASETPGKFNVLRGNDPSKWVQGLPTFERVVYHDRWPGIDLAFRGGPGVLRYELDVRPGSDLSSVRIAIDGARSVSVDEAGNLRIATALGGMVGGRPIGLTLVGGERVEVETTYALQKDSAASVPVIGFRAVERLDPHRPFVIDAGFAYSALIATKP